MSAFGSFYVAGVSFGERQETMHELELAMVKDPTPKTAKLVAEPENEFDAKAIRVEVETSKGWQQVGYVPRKINEEFGALITANRVTNVRLASVGRPGQDKPLGGKIVFDVMDEATK